MIANRGTLLMQNIKTVDFSYQSFVKYYFKALEQKNRKYNGQCPHKISPCTDLQEEWYNIFWQAYSSCIYPLGEDGNGFKFQRFTYTILGKDNVF